MSETSSASILHKIVLADLLDDAILNARPGSAEFPLRVLLGELGARAATDAGFTFASGLSFFFRAAMEDEVKARLGVEVSRAYYAFCVEAALEAQLVKQASPLLAQLMTTELSRLKLESVDHTPVFDSGVHERDDAADKSNARIKAPLGFMTRVRQTGLVRIKARVMT
jgi:hypothetical protein